MYLPKHFAQPDREQLARLMAAHPLATLVSRTDDGFSADHIPLMYDPSQGEHGLLRGHVARANPLWRAAAGSAVLAVFSGPQAYITPSWYAAKSTNAKVVPTWNYAVVHAQGPLRAIEDADWLHRLVSDLTRRHEEPRAHPWQVSDAPEDYVQQMLRAIVGIEIPLTSLVGKWKVTQNRSEADRLGVAAGLGNEVGDDAAQMAALIRSASD
ncbi:MAG: FMN-binding negative transcriptional regulator [Pseudomonadota bacterium]